MRFLLDTNVFSELQRKRPHPAVRAWFDGVEGQDLYLSVVTIGEITRGIEQLRPRDRRRASVLDDWLAGLSQAYADRVLSIDHAVARRWGELTASAPVPGLIAATALVHDLTVATRNVRDFDRTGARLIDPFADD